jgi:hypothetical protein
MRARVTKQFFGRPDHEYEVRDIEVGEEIDGELAKIAVKDRNATPIREVEEAPAQAKLKEKKGGQGDGDGKGNPGGQGAGQ